MDHDDHVNLLRGGIDGTGGVWSDLGAGSGAFTLALRDLVGPEAEIHAVDRDTEALRHNREAMRTRFPANQVTYHTGDFTKPLALPPLDGIVMANSLHFQRDQAAVVGLLRPILRQGGRLIIVEYNIEYPSGPVPYPVPYSSWERLASDSGLTGTRLLARRPSRFLREIYSAVSFS